MEGNAAVAADRDRYGERNQLLGLGVEDARFGRRLAMAENALVTSGEPSRTSLIAPESSPAIAGQSLCITCLLQLAASTSSGLKNHPGTVEHVAGHDDD